MMASDWQPIETAPKDGTRVLLSAPRHLHMIGSWLLVSGVYNHQPAWWSNNSPIYPQPTHWMPLPAMMDEFDCNCRNRGDCDGSCTHPEPVLGRRTDAPDAVPDLLAALKVTRDRLQAFVGAVADITDCSGDVDALNAADAAIAKATGGQS